MVAYEDTALVLDGVYVEDSDIEEAGSGTQLDVDIEAQHGSLGFSNGTINPPGVLFLRETGVGGTGHLLAMRGSLNFINAALSRLTYTPDRDWSGSDEVVITVDDRGFTGSGGPGKDRRGIPIDVRSVNDAHIVMVTPAGIDGAGTTAQPPPLQLSEDGRVILHNVTLYDADVNPQQLHGQILGISSGTSYEDYPADVRGGQFQVTVKVGNGRLYFQRTAGLRFDAAVEEELAEGEAMVKLSQGGRLAAATNAGEITNSPNSTASLGAPAVPWWREARFTGRLDDCNRALEAMMYWPPINWNGVDVVKISADESPSEGAAAVIGVAVTSSPSTAEATIYVRVAALNDAPVVTPPSPRFHPTLRTGDLLSSTAAYGTRAVVTEESELLLPGFVIRDVDLAEDGGDLALITITVTARHGRVSLTWHGVRSGVGPGDSRHPSEPNSLGPDLTGLLFHDDVTGEWAPWNASTAGAASTITFRACLTDANAVLESLAFTPDENFFGSGAWVRVEAFDSLSGYPTGTALESTLANAVRMDMGSARGVATVPISILPVNDAPLLHLPFSEDGFDIIQLDEGEERRLSGARWRGSFAATVHASTHLPLRTGVELWRSQGVFPGKDAGRWGKGSELEWKETLVADLNVGVGDGSPRHFAAWGGYLFFQVRAVVTNSND